MNRYRPVELILPRSGHEEVSQIARQICDPFIVNLRIGIEDMKIGSFLERISKDTSSPVIKKLYKKFIDEGSI